MRSKSGIYIDVNGSPLDLADVSWIQVAPCGCTAGIHVAYSDYGRGEPMVLATAAQVVAESMCSKAEAQQDEERGFIWKAVPHGEFGTTDCKHEPRWGYEHAPQLDGMLWAVGGWHDNRTRTQHLVPEEVVTTDDRKVDWSDSKAKPLCGATEKYPWSNRWHERDGRVECKRCWKKAAEINAAQGVLEVSA